MVSATGPCKTSRVAYREQFWVVAGAAAPVIALAAVVATNDAAKQADEWKAEQRKFGAGPVNWMAWLLVVSGSLAYWLLGLTAGLEALVLTLSLASLASGYDQLTPPAVTFLCVIGLYAMSFQAALVVFGRRQFAKLREIARNHADPHSDDPNEKSRPIE